MFICLDLVHLLCDTGKPSQTDPLAAVTQSLAAASGTLENNLSDPNNKKNKDTHKK